MNLKIEEGPKYKYSEFRFEDNRVASTEELQRLLNLKKGEVFSKEQFDKSVYENMMSIYQNKGYIFSNVTPVITPVGENSLDILFKFNEGNKVYIDQIFVSGNEKMLIKRRSKKLHLSTKNGNNSFNLS